ncbi:MAG: hypothetical protein AB1637_05345 [Elusimicrobiota bacterium]
MDEKTKEKYMTAAIICFALILSSFIMAGVVFIFITLGINTGFLDLMETAYLTNILRPALYLIALSFLFVSRFVDEKILKNKFSSQDEILKALLYSSTIKGALGELCALNGFILFIFTGNLWDFLLLFSVSLIYGIYNFPRKTFWEDFIRSVKTGAVNPS